MNFNEFIESATKYLPILKERLNKNEDNNEFFNQIEEILKINLPDDFKDLYLLYNGEKFREEFGFFAGFGYMKLNNVVDTIKINRTIESILLPDNNDKIIEESISQKILIPFATDWGSCNFAIDLKPSQNGKIGQIIAVDLDYDNCFYICDSISDFYEIILKMLKDNFMFYNNESKAFDLKCGHFIDSIDKIKEYLGDINE